MVFEVIDLKPRNPYLSLALDEAIALYCSQNREIAGGIRLWANQNAIVLGRSCKPHENITPELIESRSISNLKSNWREGVNICRRASGGGTVLHGPGNINFSFFFPIDKFPLLYPVNNSYQIILNLVKVALERMGIECEQYGSSDLALIDKDGQLRKISGNAQFRKQGILVHHGTLITNSELIEKASSALLHPPREPDYRTSRSHSDFMGQLPSSFDLSAFYNTLQKVFGNYFNSTNFQKLPANSLIELFRVAKKMVRENYGRSEWIMQGKSTRKTGGDSRATAT